MFEADLEKLWFDAGPKGPAEKVEAIGDLLADRCLIDQMYMQYRFPGFYRLIMQKQKDEMFSDPKRNGGPPAT
jgi:hypothetical protein